MDKKGIMRIIIFAVLAAMITIIVLSYVSWAYVNSICTPSSTSYNQTRCQQIMGNTLVKK